MESEPISEKVTETSLDELTPAEIVRELDKYIIGQSEAKKAVAIALRNRARRKNVPKELQDEISPKNIIMIGPTGVGKTEVARRLAKLNDAPFLKIEASKFTEVGYVGRDVESMIRDLVNIAVNQVKTKAIKDVKKDAEKMTEDRILDCLIPPPPPAAVQQTDNKESPPQESASSLSTTLGPVASPPEIKKKMQSYAATREKFRDKLQKGQFEEKYIEVESREPQLRNAFIEFIPEQGMEQMDQIMQQMVGSLSQGGQKKKKMKVADARKYLETQISDKLIDMDKVVANAVELTENMGIIFLDEIDKIASRESGKGPDVSREGVQRDLLPLVEGSSVNTRFGVVKTDHILFIASGAFHVSKPSDLIPELQGRFPIRVELNPLSVDDLLRILTEPKNCLVRQYKALLSTEHITLDFSDDALKTIANIAHEVNLSMFNIGARRLATVMEKLLEDILFNAPNTEKNITISSEYVVSRLKDIKENKDLSKYIL